MREGGGGVGVHTNGLKALKLANKKSNESMLVIFIGCTSELYKLYFIISAH